VPITGSKPVAVRQSTTPVPLFPVPTRPAATVPGVEKSVVPQGPRRPLIVFPK
jgi:hypothetical protein